MNKRNVLDYYAAFGEREWDRLEPPAIGSIEFSVTCHALQKYLPADGLILDLGGGPGRYTIWLAQHGYRIVLADLSPDLLAIARSKIKQFGVEDKVQRILEADARDLSAFDDSAFDAVLALGPFYHLPDEEDRLRATKELYRILRPDGPAFIALMPKYAFLRRTILLPEERHHLLDPKWVDQLMQKGIFENEIADRFTHGFGVSPQEVPPFFEKHGFQTVNLLALEGFTAGLESILADLFHEDRRPYNQALELIMQSAGDPSILGMAIHILYVGRKVGP
jgi:ubiquinone/menaquinone biosynthesis C-methylase UbiE